ncbi:hypothetical protein SAEN111111_05250 [Saccharibacillus endophyticus]
MPLIAEVDSSMHVGKMKRTTEKPPKLALREFRRFLA